MNFETKKKNFAMGLFCTASAIALASPALAQDDGATSAEEAAAVQDTIVVTATRRAESVQDIPLNIAAVGSQQIEEQGLTELGDLLGFVPGINVLDGGGRQGNPIVVRGINATPLGSGDDDNTGGGTVATYLGDIPVFVDLKLNDLERVEVLLGPQGTLYGSGTLGGAIRYIPKRPDFSEDSFQLRGSAYTYGEADGASWEGGFTVNKRLTDRLAVRASLDYVDDTGFIDQPFIVREVGVSDPDGFADPANFDPQEDTNGEEVLSLRAAVRWQPTDWLDGTFTYYRQESDIEGRTISSRRTPLQTGRYENGLRVLEPNDVTNELFALEVTADLGFAELTSATGFSEFNDDGQRDQTDLLISLEYSYELFPTFTSFTRELTREERFNQEIRLVSTHKGPLSWIVGGFYNEFDRVATSAEFTPLYAEFAGLVNRPDDLEFFDQDLERTVEQALFGEVAYDITDRLTLTLGGRYYEYKVDAFAQTDFPLFGDNFDGDNDDTTFGAPPTLDEVEQNSFNPLLNQEDDGFLFKVNASYDITDDILAFATVSEGFRVGGSNGLSECTQAQLDDISNDVQAQCGLTPGQVITINGQQVTNARDETQFGADTTRNYELGLKTAWMDGRLKLNGSLFYVDWMDPQLDATTIGALLGITVNAEGASSTGVELSGDFQATDRWNLRGSFSYTDSKLTADAPGLVGTISPPGFGPTFEDGLDGDRLPGSPETQFSLATVYEYPLPNGKDLDLFFSYAWQSDVLTRTGSRGNGFVLDSFGVANARATYDAGDWRATVFVDNLFDEFGEVGARDTQLFNQVLTDANGGPVNTRRFFTSVIAPRSFGVRFVKDF